MSLSVASLTGSAPVSNLEKCSGVLLMSAAKSAAFLPTLFLKNLISAPSKMPRLMTMASAITFINCSGARISAAWAPHVWQTQYFTPTKYTLDNPESTKRYGLLRVAVYWRRGLSQWRLIIRIPGNDVKTLVFRI